MAANTMTTTVSQQQQQLQQQQQGQQPGQQPNQPQQPNQQPPGFVPITGGGLVNQPSAPNMTITSTAQVGASTFENLQLPIFEC